MLKGFFVLPLLAEGVGQAPERSRVRGVDFQGEARVLLRFLEPVELVKRHRQVGPHPPGRRVEGENVTVEGDVVAVYL